MKISIDCVFRKKNLFFFIIFFLFFFSFSSLFSSSERSVSLFLTPDSNVNDDVRELPLVHNVYIFLTFFCFLATIFFFTFFFKGKKEENFTFKNVSRNDVRNVRIAFDNLMHGGKKNIADE